MRTLSYGLALVCSVVAASLYAQGARAQVRCQWNSGNVLLPTASRNISDWEVNRSVKLSPKVRSKVEADICGAIQGIEVQSGVPTPDIDAATRKPIWEYLDDTLSRGTQFPSLLARMEAVFLLGASGQLPEQRRMAVVTFRFTRPVDRIFVGNVQWMLPVDRLVSEYGTFSYRGLQAGRKLCQGSFAINSSTGATVRC